MNSGSISQDEYDLQHEYLSGQYQTQLAEVQAKAVSYQVETIKRHYAEELAAAGPELEQRTGELLNETLAAIQNGASPETNGEHTPSGCRMYGSIPESIQQRCLR